ncbi:hypothetical protein GCM10010412_071940 [Nonomuraea recticatena]|uniref:Secreted protein n=1 Tax=Nonomuraea recticatena TaxID=46178 RepID=A0ABP6F7Z0_9ACTN
MEPFFAVLRVVKVLPQVQVTWVTLYSGWMSRFIASPFGVRSPGRSYGLRADTLSDFARGGNRYRFRFSYQCARSFNHPRPQVIPRDPMDGSNQSQ